MLQLSAQYTLLQGALLKGRGSHIVVTPGSMAVAPRQPPLVHQGLGFREPCSFWLDFMED